MANQKRTLQFYRKNEAEVMLSLGLKPTINSGAGWIEKEDGHNDHVISQLKSTDAQSISLKLKDIQILEYNASVAHKLPLFIIQFLGTEDVFMIARPADFEQIAKYISFGEAPTLKHLDLVSTGEDLSKPEKPKVKSNSKSRDSFWDQRREEFENGKRR